MKYAACVSEPLETIKTLVGAINNGDVEAALSHYEPDAIIVVEPGKIAQGKSAVRTALEGFISLRPTLKSEGHQAMECGGHLSACHLTAKPRKCLEFHPMCCDGSQMDAGLLPSTIPGAPASSDDKAILNSPS